MHFLAKSGVLSDFRRLTDIVAIGIFDLKAVGKGDPMAVVRIVAAVVLAITAASGLVITLVTLAHNRNSPDFTVGVALMVAGSIGFLLADIAMRLDELVEHGEHRINRKEIDPPQS